MPAHDMNKIQQMNDKKFFEENNWLNAQWSRDEQTNGGKTSLKDQGAMMQFLKEEGDTDRGPHHGFDDTFLPG